MPNKHLVDDVERGNLTETSKFKWNKFYRARVISAEDERQLGRVKVHIPDLMPEEPPDGPDPTSQGLWAHPANNALGGRNIQDGVEKLPDDSWYQGSCMIPPKGCWVWIFFENGDPNHPYYFGAGDFGQRKVLPENQVGNEYWKKWTLIKSREGRCIIVSDDGADCRVEITGKKRLISNEPDGDIGSVYEIDGNQTTILLDEREGEEKVQIKDYRGNYITLHTNSSEGKDQLHIYMKDQIHIETETDMFIKTGGNLDIKNGGNFKHFTTGSMNRVSIGNTRETAILGFNRLSVTTDNRTSVVGITDIGLLKNDSIAGLNRSSISFVKNSRVGGIEIDDIAGIKSKYESFLMNITKGKLTMSEGTFANQVTSELGPVVIDGELTMVETGKLLDFNIPGFAFFIPFPALIARFASSARPAGNRKQPTIPGKAPTPPVPQSNQTPPPTIVSSPEIGDPYEIHVGELPIKPPTPKKPIVQPPPIIPSPAPVVTPPTECNITTGVCHSFILSLKDQYRDKIIPLVDKSYGTILNFSLFQDPSGYDTDFIDTDALPVFDNYYNPTDLTVIDDTTKWWRNLDEILEQAKTYDMTVIPSLFDFRSSPNDPFIKNTDDKYTTFNWDDSIQGNYVKKVIEHIKNSGVDYIINMGRRDYAEGYPTQGYMRKLIYWISEDCNVSFNNLAISDTLYEQNPYTRYTVLYGDTAPSQEEINLEEYVDSQYGGTGRVSVYNDDGDLIDGYEYYLRNSCDGIAAMVNWKMNEYVSSLPSGIDINDDNVMNYIFAPRQRAAMRKVLSDNTDNNGFIDFS